MYCKLILMHGNSVLPANPTGSITTGCISEAYNIVSTTDKNPDGDFTGLPIGFWVKITKPDQALAVLAEMNAQLERLSELYSVRIYAVAYFNNKKPA